MIAAGRTDAGVHARGQVASFPEERPLPISAYVKGMNALLPEDVAVRAATLEPDGFDARRSARGKRYRYVIENGDTRAPLTRLVAWQLFGPLDVAAMREAARHLVGRHDFAAFQAADCEAHHAVREVRRLDVIGESGRPYRRRRRGDRVREAHGAERRRDARRGGTGEAAPGSLPGPARGPRSEGGRPDRAAAGALPAKRSFTDALRRCRRPCVKFSAPFSIRPRWRSSKMSQKKLKVGVLGATGMVGQRFLALLENHPWYEVTLLGASANSAGQKYADAVKGRWALKSAIPAAVAGFTVRNASDVKDIAGQVDFVFCAVDMSKEETAKLEEDYARAETPVVSNNSAHRGTPDVPMMIPEVNPEHSAVIEAQRKRLGTRRGFIAVKPNCSLQSYVPAIHPLMRFGPKRIAVCTYQAISGAGKTFETWPEMMDNLIPFIKGEEEKSEQEPMKIWGSLAGGRIEKAKEPVITAQCIRVPASDGHMAAAFVQFDRKPDKAEVIELWRSWVPKPQKMGLPSAPKPFLTYFEDDARPQTRLDRDIGNGMGVAIGRLRPDALFDYRFVSLSHNTVRGAAGGAVLTAELLTAEGFIQAK